MRELDVVVPVLNEQDSVNELVARVDKALKSAGINYGIIFVDDHSTDFTVKRIKALQRKYPVRLLTKKGKRGKAYSILEGAKASRARSLAMIDGDLQYPPEALPEMFELLKTNGLVVANRRKNEISKIRKIGSDASSNLVGRLILGINCDAQSGLKVFKRELIEAISSSDVKPWALDMPLIYTARAMGEKVGSVEIDFAKREQGRSKVNFVRTASEIITTALRLRLRGKKTFSVKPANGHPTLGAGVVHRRKKYVTHSSLPYHQSALFTLVTWQKWALVAAISLLGAGLIINYLATLVVLTGILSLIYFSDVVFSGWVLFKSLHFPPELKFTKREIDGLNDESLPVYTILCPLYKEGRVLGGFVESIKKLEWPKSKLDVLILLEEDDEETLSAANEIRLPDYIKIVIVPDSQPRTKPKACNYGLALAKGDYVVVYDAEDKPDPQQLKKAYLGFRRLGKKVFCLQSKLNYYNPSHNILTRLFTAEYSLWFDVILPGLQSIEASIPLGGTSNHFRTKELVKLHAWDPFNVTEDCDLGVRIFKSGGKTAIIESTTYEEANSSVRNWVRQRSRWIKGYIQTYLVHMRNPVGFVKRHGIHALIFQLIIGMRISFLFINPFLWMMTIAYFTFRSTLGPSIEALYPAPIFYMAAFALVVGNFMYFYNYMIGCAKRGNWDLVKYVFLVPVYWVLASVASFKALKQLIFKPHFWEKTHHGLFTASKKQDKKIQDIQDIKEPDKKYFVPKGFIPAGVSAGALLVFAGVVANFLDFVTSTYLGRNLSPEEFGLVGMMIGFLFIAQLPALGVGQTLSHRSAFLLGKYGLPAGKLWRVYAGRMVKIAFLASFVWLLATPLLTTFFNSHTYVPFIVFAPVWMFVMAGAVSSGFLEGNLRFGLLALGVVAGALSKLVFSAVFVHLGLTDWVYSALPISFLVGATIVLFFARRVSNSSLSKEKMESAETLKFPRKFFFTSILTNASAISFLSLDVLFAKHFLSALEAGQYALLALTGRMVFITGGFFIQFILPIVSRLEGKGLKSGSSFRLLFLAVLGATSFTFVLVGPFGGVTLPLLFGDRANAIIPFTTPFALSMIFFSLAYSVVVLNQAMKRYFVATSGLLAVITQVAGLYFYRGSIEHTVGVMLGVGVVFLSCTLVLHIFYHRIVAMASNIYDFFGLFLLKLNGKNHASDKLNILMYNWRDIKHVWAGGAEVYVHELAKRWVKAGHKVTLFCGNDGRNTREEEIDGVKIIRRGGFYTVYLWAFLYYLIHFRGRYDLIIESENGVPFMTPLYSTKPKILVVHHVHQEVFQEHLAFPLSLFAKVIESGVTPIIYRGVKTIAVSGSTRSDLIHHVMAKEERVSVVSPGVDVAAFGTFDKTPYPSFVYLGRHKAYKNIDVAIKAFAKTHEKYPQARLTIAGEGEMTRQLKDLAHELGVRKFVYFTGKVSEEDKIYLLGKSWAAIQPSSFEGWGITVLEANAAGTPVIASRVNGLTDSVIDGKTGLLVPAKDVSAFASAMESMVVDDELRWRMSDRAFKWAQEHDWQNSADSFMRIVWETVEKDKALVVSGDIAPQANYSYEDE